MLTPFDATRDTAERGPGVAQPRDDDGAFVGPASGVGDLSGGVRENVVQIVRVPRCVVVRLPGIVRGLPRFVPDPAR